jgi:hypothetical protein
VTSQKRFFCFFDLLEVASGLDWNAIRFILDLDLGYSVHFSRDLDDHHSTNNSSLIGEGGHSIEFKRRASDCFGHAGHFLRLLP